MGHPGKRGEDYSLASTEDSSSSLPVTDKSLRQRIDLANATLANGNIILLDAVPSVVKNVSSSLARHHSFNNSMDELRRIVPSNVVDYIIQHELYGFNNVEAANAPVNGND